MTARQRLQRAREAAEIARERERLATARLDPSTALRRLKGRMAQRRRDLLNPDWGDPRRFPTYYPGLSTATYIRTFQAMNNRAGATPLNPLTFTFKEQPK